MMVVQNRQTANKKGFIFCGCRLEIGVIAKEMKTAIS
jgi:hypothetical protein